MHSPKKKKNNLSSNVQKGYRFSLSGDQEIRHRHLNKRRGREERIKQPFYTMQRINPLGSTVSMTSMLYCIYRLILLLWV
ncbi:unnamed protein product [Staurois parvus]|uniref:Uncharacterized protein n=1 Tax=Staurois parvus TaxID=386267 RepID=A0ABN9E084_9NEOB|nr:unnamed protein product [Staurois parvus]